jgi:hypothetical protein
MKTRRVRQKIKPISAVQEPKNMNSIFHAFSMKYSHISRTAQKLVELGFTHVQFPPIQETRILTELDIELLAKQIQNLDKQLEDFADLCKEAQIKEKLYTPHRFDFLLQQRIFTIRQPIIKYLHKCILSGINVKDVYKFLYNESDYKEYISTDSYPYQSELITAAKIVIQLLLQPPKFIEYVELNEITEKYKNLQLYIKEQVPNVNKLLIDEINEVKGIKARLLQKKERWVNYIEQLNALHNLVPNNVQIREKLHRNFKIIPHSLSTKKVKTIPFQKEKVKYWVNCMTVCELLLYPPWWLIYQPMKLGIGDTLLGSKEEILEAIHICKLNGLQVIADIVINNLAAVAGEKKSWIPFLANASSSSQTLADIIPSNSDEPQLHKIKNLLTHAFSTDDLSLLTIPYECNAEHEATHCWMSGALPQLNQEHPAIKLALHTFIDSLKSAGISGVRIDAAAHLMPHICEKVVKSFNGLSYIEYVGNSSELYNSLRLEDFAIGEDLYLSIFSQNAQTQRLINYGDMRLKRMDNLDSVTMIVNHDHIMGSIPSKVFSELPSRITYELSVAYLIQRIYGNPLILPHDIQFPLVQKALQLRKNMRDFEIVHEHVYVNERHIIINKFDNNGAVHFIAIINLDSQPIVTQYGEVPPLSFEWFKNSEINAINKNMECIYNNTHNQWMPKYCYPSKQIKKRTTRKQTHQN